MAASITAPQQYSQSSRKGKKAWRKNIDISEVQDGLDAVRTEVIRTGGVISEKPSEALFAIDSVGSEETRKKVKKVLKQLKADQVIAQRSAVPSVDTRKRMSAVGTTNGIIEPTSKRVKTDRVQYKELLRLKKRAFGGENVYKDVVQAGSAATADLWAEVAEPQVTRPQWIAKAKPRVAPKTLRHAPVSLLENGKSMPAVPRPNPGISYNPQFDDYDRLLRQEGDREVTAEMKRIEESRKEEERQARIEAAQDEIDKSEYYTEDESVWEGIESEIDGIELKKKLPERKTPAERNRVKRRKAAEREAKHQARMEERGRRGLRNDSSPNRVSGVRTGDDDGKPFEIIPALSSSDDEIDDRRLRRRKFGTVPVPEKPLELVLTDELQDSLRLLKPEGNLLKDRFRNYLVGGKIETRRPGFQAKKAKRKATEKWTYKDFRIPTS